jgi:hypothetical protein
MTNTQNRIAPIATLGGQLFMETKITSSWSHTDREATLATDPFTQLSPCNAVYTEVARGGEIKFTK